MKCRRYIIYVIRFLLLTIGVIVTSGKKGYIFLNAADDTLAFMEQYNGVTLSPDGTAWTTDYRDKTNERLHEGYTILTGEQSILRELQAGEHYYKVKAEGRVPVKAWIVAWSNAQCIHPYEGQNYKGFSVNAGICYKHYNNGWNAVCAVCDEIITDMYIYAKSSTVKKITHLPGSADYLYICPHCNGLEQGCSYIHYCKAISYNGYSVKYEKNPPKGNVVKGYMADTRHMYNNANYYDGQAASELGYSDIRLRKNSYSCAGYVFTGWNTEPDGSGKSFRDGQDIINLTENNGEMVVLYAQWEEAYGILIINAGGGTYCGESIFTVRQRSSTGYILQENSLIPAFGYKVSFETNGGSTVPEIYTQKQFLHWIEAEPMYGDVEQNTYYFPLQGNTVDTITAQYTNLSFILPESEKAGEYLAGWYADAACTETSFIGVPGAEVSVAKDTVLYAKWMSLALTAVDNYTAFQGKGAVDLYWNRQIEQNAIYKAYQSADKKEWNLISSLEASEQVTEISKAFGTKEQGNEYVIPYTGYYELSAFGAKGADYSSSKPGGKGGFVSAEFWLMEGDVLTFYAGSAGTGMSGGTNGNGANGGNAKSNTGTGGGAASEIYLFRNNQSIPLIVAGGGSGAGSSSAGESGGTELTGIGSRPGYSSSQGGGGGAVGGKAETLYSQTTIANPAVDSIAFMSGWTKYLPKATQLCHDCSKFYNYSGYPVSFLSEELKNRFQAGKAITTGLLAKTLSINRKNADPEEEHFGTQTLAKPENGAAPYYRVYQIQGEFSRCFSATYPVNGNTNLVVSGGFDMWGDSAAASIRFIVSNARTNTVLYDRTYINGSAGKVVETQPVSWEMGVWDDFYVAGTEEVTVEVIIHENGSNADTKAYVLDTFFYGKKSVIGEYAKGGSSYVNTSYGCKNIVYTGGSNDGFGNCRIESKDVGYMSVTNLNNVFSPDKEQPNLIKEYSVSKEAEGNYHVVWKEPGDLGSDYYHKVESYRLNNTAAEKVSESNITLNNLVSGVKRYYYYVDTASEGNVSKSHSVTLETELVIQDTGSKQYLHIAPMDGAGNLGNTTDIELLTFEELLQQQIKVSTEQLKIKESAYVYASENNRYYVKADGKTEHTLCMSSKTEKTIGTEYQINNMTLYFSKNEGNSWFSTRVPLGNPSLAEESFANDLLQMECGEECESFLKVQSAAAIRKEHGLTLELMQGFTVSKNGEEFSMYPQATVQMGENIITSDSEKDFTHGIIVIPDGEAPDIMGMQLLDEIDILDMEEQTVTLELSAYDKLSGLEDFYLLIENMDNHMKEEFHCEEDGKINLVIDKENPLFIGKITISAAAVDKVGNGNVIGENGLTFTLQTHIYRERNPEDSVVKTGDGVVLDITASGYVEKIEVIFPEEMTAVMPELNRVYEYEYPYLRNTESVRFNVPLGIAEKTYEIFVSAYKDGQVLKRKEVLVVVSGNVLDELRTRIRNNG